MLKKLMFILSLVLYSSTSFGGVIYTEDFEDPFPVWESNWLGTYSNIQNVYGVGADRGNNPDGLWIADGLGNGSAAEITFDLAFGSTITNFSIDVTSWIQTAVFEAFDVSGNIIHSIAITSFAGGYSDPGSYQTISFSSVNGLGGFNITGGSIEGNTSIDNVIATTGAVNVSEPTSIAVLGLGLLGFALRRKKQTS